MARTIGLETAPVGNEKVEPIAFQIAFPIPFGSVYHDDLSRARKLTVVLGSNVIKLGDDGRSVTTAEICTLGGLSHLAKARAVGRNRECQTSSRLH